MLDVIDCLEALTGAYNKFAEYVFFRLDPEKNPEALESLSESQLATIFTGVTEKLLKARSMSVKGDSEIDAERLRLEIKELIDSIDKPKKRHRLEQ